MRLIDIKIENDKYYTSPELAEYIVNKTKEIIGEEKITEYIEPSAGAGVFLDYIDKPYLAYDIEPEDDRIIKQDFLKFNLEYKKGRCIIGNPPYGDKNILVKQFFNSCLNKGDYISFILPITQLNNTQSLYKFELIYSEDLGERLYSSRLVHCCLNIYKRPEDGKLATKKDYSLNDITLIEYKRGKEIEFGKYDFSICTWGNGSCGKIPCFKGQYAQEHYFIIHNDNLKEKILKLCYTTDWKNEVAPKNTSSKKIQSWRIYKYIKEQIPEIN